MKGYLSTLSLALLLGVAGAASATTAVLDLGDPTKSTDAKLVANADGKVTDVKEGTIAAVQTSGTDGTNGYLYIDVKNDLFKAGKPLFVRVDYLDKGTDTLQLEYDNDSDANTVARPVLYKYDTKAWTSQSFKIIDANLQGRQTGGSDLRINDNGDGPEVIRKVTVTDVDPDTVQFPKNDPAKPIVIDGKKSDGEWDGAYSITMDKAEFDVIRPSKFKSKEDFSGTYSFKWDDQGIYVLGEVNDATPRLNDADGSAAWNGDGIELFISLDWSDPSHTSYIDGSDFHIFLGMGATPKWGNEHAGGTDDLGDIPAKNGAVVNTDKGYMFEVLVPWAIMNKDFKPKEGQNIGFYMFANNSTVTPSSQEIAMAPWKRNGPSGNPSRWATAVLSPSLKVENPVAGQ
jgi:hypothetical protein